MRYAYAETTPVLNLAAPSQIRGGWPEVGTTAAESTRLPHTHTHTLKCLIKPSRGSEGPYKALKGLLRAL